MNDEANINEIPGGVPTLLFILMNSPDILIDAETRKVLVLSEAAGRFLAGRGVEDASETDRAGLIALGRASIAAGLRLAGRAPDGYLSMLTVKDSGATH